MGSSSESNHFKLDVTVVKSKRAAEKSFSIFTVGVWGVYQSGIILQYSWNAAS